MSNVLTNGDDIYTAAIGSGTTYALDGNDTVTLGGLGTIYGGAGNDMLTGASGLNFAWLYGDQGNDTLRLLSGAAGVEGGYLDGGPGSDSLYSYGGFNTLVGGGDNDYIEAHGIDHAFGDAGNDVIVSVTQSSNPSGFSLTAYGGLGDDKLYGGAFADLLIGGEGVDLLVGNGGDDYLYLGTGGGSAYGGDGADVGVGSQLNDVFVLGAGNDTAYGYAGNDYFYGETGNDTLYGGDGVDVLIGGAGGDFLDGGEGVNYYFGGNGAGPGTGLGPDIFVARDIPGVQVIQDWTSGQGKVQLEGSGISNLAGVLSHGFQNGAYYVIQIDGDTAVWLNGATATSLTAADFLFVS